MKPTSVEQTRLIGNYRFTLSISPQEDPSSVETSWHLEVIANHLPSQRQSIVTSVNGIQGFILEWLEDRSIHSEVTEANPSEVQIDGQPINTIEAIAEQLCEAIDQCWIDDCEADQEEGDWEQGAIFSPN